MKRLTCAASLVLLLGLVGVAQAADDPTGTWKWTVTFGGQSREVTLKLKLEGETLSGTITGRDNQEMAIEEAAFKEGEVSFKVTRERNGRKRTMKYAGKLSGDAITGTVEFERDGQVQSRPWEAKRSAE